jgi:glycosyltransferase involved in cell wall biosynthesis
MNICVLHNEYESKFPSGETEAVLKQVELLRHLGADYSYICKNSDSFVSANLGHKLFIVLRSVLMGIPSISATENRIIGKADVVVIHNTFPYFGFKIIRKIKKKNVRIILTIHNARTTCLSGSHYRKSAACFKCTTKKYYSYGVLFGCYRENRLESLLFARYMNKLKKSFNLVDQFIVLNRFSKQTLLNLGIPATKVHVIQNSVAGPSELSNIETRTLLFAGRLSKEKGIDLLLEAFVKSQISQGGWQLHLAGSGPLSEKVLEYQKRNSGIVFHGQVNQEQIDELIQNCCLVLVPSVAYEGFPNMISKAAAHGRPVLLSEVGPLTELKSFSWVKSSEPNVSAWANQLREIVSTPFVLSPNLEARNWWETNASVEAVKQNFLKILYKK